jgi:hypothetical protein
MREKQPIIEEITRALGDEVVPESDPWWQYAFVVSEVGEEGARQIVREVSALEAAGGMTTRDGSRRRSPGGVFFALAYEQLGPKRAKSVRLRAHRRVQGELLQKLLRLLALALPAAPERPVTTPASPDATKPSSDATKPSSQAAKPSPEAAKPSLTAPVTSTPKPARRPEPEVVEVLVSRRPRPAPAGPAAEPESPVPPAPPAPAALSPAAPRRARVAGGPRPR